AQLEEWGEWLRSRLGLDVRFIGERTGEMVREFVADIGGRDLIGRAGGVLEWMMVPVLVFFGAIFAIGKPNDRLLVPFLRIFPGARRDVLRHAFELLGNRLTGWVKGQIISMITVGALATI